MYKVFIQNRPLTFIHSKNISKFSGIFLSESVANSKKELILNELKKDSSTNIFFIFSKNPLKTFNNFFNNFKFIEASGGIVKRKQKYLFGIYLRERLKKVKKLMKQQLEKYMKNVGFYAKK